MKNSVFIIILLALGLVFVSYKWATSADSSEPETKAVINNAAIENIMTRTSVRAYTDRKISNEQIDTLLRAAMAAPTAGNKQPWRFVVVNERYKLDKIGNEFESMTMMKQAPLAVVVCGDTTATFTGEGVGYWIQDASAATENLLLAAHAMGLGAVWCGVYPVSERVKRFTQILNLPGEILPLSCIAIGYPSGENVPKDKWNPDHVRYNNWNAPEPPHPYDHGDLYDIIPDRR